MSSTPSADCDEVEEGETIGGAECDDDLSPEAPPHTDTDGQAEENLYPFDNLAVELYEPPEGTAEKRDEENNGEIAEALNDESNNDSTNANEESYTSDVYDASGANEQMTEEQEFGALRKTYIEDFIYSNTSSFDEGSNSNLDDSKDEPKGIPLRSFPKIVRAVEIAEYETLQILYQLLFQRSAWDTQEILNYRILEFSGFTFKSNSEDFFNRDMMLQTQPNEVLIKLGAILCLDEVQKMFSDPVKGRVDLSASILQFLTRPCKKTRVYSKSSKSNLSVEECLTASESKCGCRNRCFSRFTPAEKKRLLEYLKELSQLNLMDSYLLTLMECKRIVRNQEAMEDYKKLKEVYYNYRCRFNKKEVNVCKGAYCILHGIKMGKVNQLQNKLKTGRNLPEQIPADKFPPIVSDDDPAFKQEIPPPPPKPSPIPNKMSPSRNLLQQAKNGPKVWMSSEEQVRMLEEELNADASVEKAVPKVIMEKCDTKTDDSKRETSPSEGWSAYVNEIRESTRQRLSHPEKWLVNVCKSKRNRGDAYISRQTKKIVPARTIGLPCKCQKKCFEKLGPENIYIIFRNFWQVGNYHLQNAYLSQLLVWNVCKRSIVKNRPSRKLRTVEYAVLVNGEKISICRRAFISIHAISEKRVRLVLTKQSAATTGLLDNRGKQRPEDDETANVKNENVKLKDFALVVKAVEEASEELLIDVHFLLYLGAAEASKVRENILEFCGFPFPADSEEYDERNEFLQRMSFKIVTEVARSFSLAVLSTKEDTVKNILTFLLKPDESFLRATSAMPLSLSDVELDDFGDMSDSDVSITCEVVEKKVECIDLLSSGEDSDSEGKPRKEKKAASPQKAIAVPKVENDPPQTVVQPFPQGVSPATSTPATTEPSQSTGVRTLRNFETICKIVNTHPHEYLVDIFDLLYLQKHEPSTLRSDILDFSGFMFDRTSTEYVKRKQLLDRMLYNSVRRIYNTLIHNTTEVKVFSKPTMITEIFQFLFKLPDYDTSVRPQPAARPAVKPLGLGLSNTSSGAIIPQTGLQTLPIQSGKLSDLKRVFQRVACFPCEYLIDVHKLLFMTDCDAKVIRNNIFAFKGFSFGVDSQEFQQRKMYLEYLTFHSLRKISSVLTTRSVDLRNSTKHELATHLTQVLAEYCNTNVETDIPSIPSIQSNPVTTISKSTPVENIVVTPILDPSHANPSPEEPSNETSITQTATPPFAISIVDARSVKNPKPTPSPRGRKRKNTPMKAKESLPQKLEPSTQFADINLPEVEQYRQLYGSNLNVYNPNMPGITGIATFNSGLVPQTMPLVNVYSQPMQVQTSQLVGIPPNLGPTIVTQVPSKQGEIILPGESIVNESEEPTSKKSKMNSSSEEANGNHNKNSAAEDDEDCDKPLSSLVGHPIDSVIKKHITDIVEQSDLANITINGVIQKVFKLYPKFDLSYRKEFMKSTLRSILYRLGEEKNSEVKEEKRDTDSPDCSVTTTNKSDTDLSENSKSSMECS